MAKNKESKAEQKKDTRKESKAEDKGEGWIGKAVKHPHQLHHDLGVPYDEPIPADELKAAAKRDDKVGERARLAMTLGKMHKKK